MASEFAGFPQEGITFFQGLKKNNTRDWFQPRKEIFDRSLKTPMEELVEALNAKLVRIAPQYITEPKKAIYRIYRDTRFSKDKTPYKTHIAASFWRTGMEKHISAGYYFSVGADEIEVAGGIYMPAADQLRTLREHIAENHQELTGLLKQPKIRKLMGELWGEKMARVPKGFAPDHPAVDYLRAKHWILFDTRLDPAVATTSKLLPELVKRFEAMAPFVEFMNRPLTVKKVKDPLMMGMR